MKWFESWFDTEYYHLLYKHRNDEEAKRFLQRMYGFLQLQQGDSVVDIGCGKGRHSIAMAELGLRVTGLDLSENSILSARQSAVEKNIEDAEFLVHDMREPYPVENCKAVFNVFTSFGYFDDPVDDERALLAMGNCLLEGGYVVQDYLNSQPLLEGLDGHVLQSMQWQEISGVRFGTEKWVDHGKIYKRILVEDERKFTANDRKDFASHSNNPLIFTEEIKMYSRDELVELHQLAGLQVVNVFGNYELEAFHKDFSPRIIVVSRKSSILAE